MKTAAPVAALLSTSEVSQLQRRTVGILVVTQVLGGVGMVVGMSVGALLVARIAGGPGLSGVAQSAVAVGAALLALPVARLMQAYGRRLGLALAYLAGVTGAALVITAAVYDSVGLALAGMFLFGGGTTAGLQSRYTATDLAEPARRGRQLSIVIWATTIGAVAGPTLAAPADRIGRPLGLPELSGPFAFSLVAFVAAALLLTLSLRPDPLLTARRLRASIEPVAAPPGRGPLAHAFGEVTRSPDALLGLSAAAVGHAVMLAVMVMTPIHIDGVLSAGHVGPGHQSEVLRVVGLVLSLHVAGMFALSPLVGFLADRLGRRQMLLAGGLVLIASCALAATSGEDSVWLSAALFLLGLGWSCTMIAGSTLLTESVPDSARPSAQGLSDLVMGLAGAAAAAFSGVVVEFVGYPTLAGGAALIAVPLVFAAARRAPRTVVSG